MKHVVYQITLTSRKKADIRPYIYIGSKSNCMFDGKNIIDKSGNVYLGSSKFPNYHNLVKSSDYEVTILKEFSTYEACILFERDIHIKFDVVADDKFFNLSIATINTYSNPGYGTYRHSKLGFFVRLPKDHPSVISGLYINSNSGFTTYNNGVIERQFLDVDVVPLDWNRGILQSRKLSGNKNPFYGKTHTSDTIEKILETRKQTYEDDPELFAKVRRDAAIRASKNFKGVPKSKESNEKRGRKNMVMLKNTLTQECVRISKDILYQYDSTVWVNPATLFTPSGSGSRWSTNGKDNVKLKSNEYPESGFWFGRTNKRKTLNENQEH